MRPFTSMIRGPSGVSLISVWVTESVIPRAAMASSTRDNSPGTFSGGQRAGMKLPVSRNGSARGNLPVIATWLTDPWLTTDSTER